MEHLLITTVEDCNVEAIGFTLAMISSPCMFIAMYYANKYSFKKAYKWLGVGFLLLAVAIVITT